MSKLDIIVMYVLLHDGTTVNKTFYDTLFQHIVDVVPALIPGTIFNAKDLCDSSFWEQLANDRTLAGKCVADMVRTGKLPFIMLGCEHEYPRTYMLR